MLVLILSVSVCIVLCEAVTHSGPLCLLVKLVPDLMTGIQNITFFQKNGIQYEWTDKNFSIFYIMGPATHSAAPWCRVCGDLICTTSQFMWLVWRNLKTLVTQKIQIWWVKLEDSSLAGYDPVLQGELLLAFQKFIVPSSSGSCQCTCQSLLDPKGKCSIALHTLGTTYPVTWPRIAIRHNSSTALLWAPQMSCLKPACSEIIG